LQGNDLLTGSRGSDLYTISLQETTSSSSMLLCTLSSTTNLKAPQGAFSDADHVGCIDTRKSTSGEIQFLGDKLLCSSNVDEDTTSRLWLQLQQNTVVLLWLW
ncbi:hypothetical protein Tco_0284665, partial [Tanacetum coccineum]